uniref:Tetratricopeptide repeat protein 36 n=1 Tax=Paramormyrops kingsleyae TaxID=1676925 RepID=A0A3B3T594_9TELE
MATERDKAVLQAIFNPTTPFGDVVGLNEKEDLTDDDGAFDAKLLKQVKDLEIQGVSAAESGDMSKALEHFNQAIGLLPQRASAYNNRAQARRLQGDPADHLSHLVHEALEYQELQDTPCRHRRSQRLSAPPAVSGRQAEPPPSLTSLQRTHRGKTSQARFISGVSTSMCDSP